MSDGYYDPYPRLRIGMPLVLVGHPGSGVAQIGRNMAGLTGLTFNDVERSSESRAGRSRALVLVQDGMEALREFEAAALFQAVRRQPCGVVVMESGLLEQQPRRTWLREHGKVVYLRRPLDVLLARIRGQLERAPGSIPEFLVGAPCSVDDLREFLEPRERALAELDSIIEAGNEHASRVANQILESLDRLVDVEQIAP